MNVLVYVLDALRADHLSCYGYERETSPNIDRLADEGIVFEQCFTPATWTRPVAGSILSGSYPPTHGTQTRHDTFHPHVPSLAEQFRTAGFETVGITTMGNVSSAVGFDAGFDEFYDLYKDEQVIAERRTSTVSEEELTEEDVEKVALPRAEDINDIFERWLGERDGDDPFFAFAWSIEPHIPYDPPEGFREYVASDYDGPVDGERECLKQVETAADLNQLKGLYDGEIAYNDACLGELLDHLRDADILDETLVVVVGDHGEAFNEHGRLTHGHAPYDELMHVPFVVRAPDGANGFRAQDLCSLIDMYPTVLEYATDGSVSLENVQGSSLADALAGTPTDVHDYVFAKTDTYDMQNTFYGVRSDTWKYIDVETPDKGGRNLLELVKYVFEKGVLTDILRNPRYYLNRYRYSETEFLYNLLEDPEERTNLVEVDPDRHARFEDLLEAWHEDCVRIREQSAENRTEVEIDDATLEQLQQLGYSE
ncbi:sulfatase-like hydrolase/transferase [Halorussus halophilus]|uniref:sulfatase-like hydrolase/transferase n=1 Tax=Halorussus halophilus TaxID=2650975 RepID=UPI001300F4A6|nr:sulfatase-like hydrolase/transferase [Halorussus halophilus]